MVLVVEAVGVKVIQENMNITLIIIGILILFSVWLIGVLGSNLNKVFAAIFMVFLIFILMLLMERVTFGACVFGIIYVGAMSILFIVFLSYIGYEGDVKGKVLKSGKMFPTLVIPIWVIFVGELKAEGVKDVIESLKNKNSEIFLEIPDYFNQLFTGYMPFFIIIAVSLLVGLGIVLLVVGITEYGTQNEK